VSTFAALLAAVQGQAPGGRTGLVMLIYLVAFIGIMWFLIIGPQRRLQKRHQQMVAAVKKGDEIMSEGGIIGTVVHVADDRVTIKTAENTRIVLARMKIARVTSGESETRT